ncbi:FtsW/RodA/SpoVE family cell cycle protein [Crystallibacter crystallopoietes]|uniref:FtsW/RodA/SpoVE family cell cycle protein n=1 Tax=Crystallibacter crystallopoietes TaxID=37928 RepID=UPI000309FED7|nr:FtsW/RodA/SpoVE family cell cycle protein [Arthrobacter crystallopoietes]
MVTTPLRGTARKPASKPAANAAATAGAQGPAPLHRPPRAAWLVRLKTLLDRAEGADRDPSGFSYYLILGSALALTAIGLLMVLSSSAVESIAEGASPFDLFMKQGMFAAGGIALMLLLSRFSVPTYKKLGWPALGLSLALLVLVFTPLGVNVNGNRNWIQLGGGVTAQPSEAAKLALGLWIACVMVRKGPLLHEWKHLIVPVLPVGGLVVLLVLAGNDLGTAMIIMLIMAGALFFGGARMKLFVVAGAVAVGCVLLMAITSPNRVARITMWLDQSCEDTTG